MLKANLQFSQSRDILEDARLQMKTPEISFPRTDSYEKKIASYHFFLRDFFLW